LRGGIELPPLLFYTGYVKKKRRSPVIPKHWNPMFIEANAYCGIQKGISKEELMIKMHDCIPLFFKEAKEHGYQNLHIEELPPVPGSGG